MKRLGALVIGMLLLGTGAAQAADTVYYYSSDTIHSEVVVTDQNRNVVERTYYAPYGQVLNRDLRDGPGYSGHEEDPETNLVYMQQRYYDPEAGRFLSTDPVQADDEGGSFNRYAYAKDNPYRYTDPFGTCPKEDTSGCTQAIPARQAFFQSNPVGKVIAAVIGNPIAAFRSNHENPLTNEVLGPGQVQDAKLSILTLAVPVAKTEQVAADVVKPMARGIASEARVLADMGLTKNTAAVSTAEGRAIPDALTGTASYEIKDTARVSATSQVRIQTDAASAAGIKSVLVTGQNTRISGPAQAAFDQIITRPDLGPQQ